MTIRDTSYNNLSPEEKYKRTSFNSFQKRGNILSYGDHWYLTHNDYPYREYNGSVVKEHLTLWAIGDNMYTFIVSIAHLIEYYHTQGYNVIMNEKKNQSVPGRIHIHFILTE